MNKKFIGTKHLLLSIINKGETETADYTIALYLLNYYDRLDEINIYDMAEECFVNRSTIRRFFTKYGYDSFLDFKKNYEDIFRDKDPMEDIKTYSDYLNILNAHIMELMSEMNLKRDKTAEIDKVIEKMYHCDRLVFIGSDTIYGQLFNAQQSLIHAGKIIHIISKKHYENKVLCELGPNDCLMVFSVTGAFANAILPIIEEIDTYKMLIILNNHEELSGHFDDVYTLTRRPREAVNEEVYRRYGMTYFLDAMITSYKIKYKHTDN